ncbi:MAG: OFA family MFS transporter [Deltaproteobacteria bacterium]|nr:OFA family MFS transporter [Deltaproteobacteria bacterium]
MKVTVNRWKFVFAALIMQLCLGVLYSWSVFRPALEYLNTWDKTVSIAPYRYSLLFFTIAMIFAGFWQDKKGPKLVGSVGGVLLGSGCLLSAFLYKNQMGLNFAYGIIGGLGVGFAYVTPIATCIKWFPDKRGMIVGLAVMGFGAGSLIFAPLIERLIAFQDGMDAALLSSNLFRTFLIMSVTFYICVIGAAFVYAVPPAGWKPEGWEPPKPKEGAPVLKEDFTTMEMVKTWQFYVLWLIYFFGTSVGITAIGQAAPFVKELAKVAAVMSGGAALGIMSFFNGIGRLAWGTTSDRIGRKATTICMFAVYIFSCLFLLRNPVSFWQALAGLCLVGFSYGGYLAMMPSFTADFYGTKNVGANYGIVFTAWGVCGFTVPKYFAGIVQAAKDAGDIAIGYNKVYFSLALFCIIGIILVFILRSPKQQS